MKTYEMSRFITLWRLKRRAILIKAHPDIIAEIDSKLKKISQEIVQKIKETV